MDKYIPDAKWNIKESDDVVHVGINGKAKGTGEEISIIIKVSQDENDPDLALITPESVTVSGTESTTQDEAVLFILGLFAIYDVSADDKM